MPQGKRWTVAEETCLAKAYLNATMDPERVTYKTGDDFSKELIEKYKVFSPEYAKTVVSTTDLTRLSLKS